MLVLTKSILQTPSQTEEALTIFSALTTDSSRQWRNQLNKKTAQWRLK